MHISTIKTYKCPSCHALGSLHSFCHEPYEDFYYCGDCSANVELERERPADWFSVAVYELNRAYGGPEEGGWYYDTGTRVDETVRTFRNTSEGREDAEKYLDSLHALHFPYRAEHRDSPCYTSRVHPETLPDQGFPRHRPVYS